MDQTQDFPEGSLWSCVVSGGYVYCVGGYDISVGVTNHVYYATLSSTGVGVWNSTTSYPTLITYQSCVVSGGHLYCVGGTTGSVDTDTNAVYSANLSSISIPIPETLNPVFLVAASLCLTCLLTWRARKEELS
jgi:hypothetical protein